MAMKPELVTIGVQIPAERAADLALVARELHCSPGALLARIAGEWLGRRRDALQSEAAETERRKREEAAARLAILQRWWDMRRQFYLEGKGADEATQKFLSLLSLSDNKQLTRGTLYNWERRWRGGGLKALVDDRHDAQQRSPHTRKLQPFRAEMRRLMATLRRPTLQACYDRAAATAEAEGWDVPSYRAVSRWFPNRPRGRAA